MQCVVAAASLEAYAWDGENCEALGSSTVILVASVVSLGDEPASHNFENIVVIMRRRETWKHNKPKSPYMSSSVSLRSAHFRL